MNVLLKLSPTTLLEEIVPKEAWFYTLAYELMKGTKDDIWDTNKKKKKTDEKKSMSQVSL